MPYEIDNFDHRPHVVPDATPTSDGVMSAVDKAKLDSLAPGGLSVQFVSHTLTAAEIVALGAVTSGAVSFGAPLPANARFIGFTAGEGAFTPIDNPGHNEFFVSIGGNAFLDQTAGIVASVGGGGVAPAASQTPPVMYPMGGVTPTARVSTFGTTLNTVTQGNVMLKLFYAVLP